MIQASIQQANSQRILTSLFSMKPSVSTVKCLRSGCLLKLKVLGVAPAATASIPLSKTVLHRNSSVRLYFTQRRNNSSIPPSKFTTTSRLTHLFSKEMSKLSDDKSYNTELTDAIKRFQDKRRKQTIIMVITSFFVSIISYQIIYKTIWHEQESYIPIWMCSRKHSLTPKEANKLNLESIHDKIIMKIFLHIMNNNTVSQWYKLPIKLNSLSNEKFNIWCENLDPVMFGIAFKPINQDTTDSENWYRIPFLFQFKFKHKCINLVAKINNFKDMINEIIIFGTPNYDNRPYIDTVNENDITFQNEYPINGSNHSMHLCFQGNLPIDEKSEIEYMGKYHIDIKFEKITLRRHINDKCIEIDLLKDDKYN